MKKVVIIVIVLIVGVIGTYATMHRFGSGYMGPGLTHLTSMADGSVMYEGRHGERVFIDRRGELTVAGDNIAVQPADRQLLLTYAHDLKSIQAGAKAVGNGGLQLAGKSLYAVVKDLVLGHSEAMSRELKSKAKLVQKARAKLCWKVRDVLKLQGRFLSAVDGFTPIDLSIIRKLDCKN